MGAIRHLQPDVASDKIEAAYRTEHGRLWRALMAYCGDADLAGDAEAEAWAQALRGRDRIDNVGAWIWTAAFRIAAGMVQQARRRQASVVTATDSDLDNHVASAPDSGAALVELFDVLDELTDQQRAAVVLQHVGRMRATEIAETLGTSPTTIRVQLHRAHRQLRQALREMP